MTVALNAFVSCPQCAARLTLAPVSGAANKLYALAINLFLGMAMIGLVLFVFFRAAEFGSIAALGLILPAILLAAYFIGALRAVLVGYRWRVRHYPVEIGEAEEVMR